MIDRKRQALMASGQALPGDNPSLAELYRRHWGELCRHIQRKFGSGPPEPEEVAQAAFARYAALENPQAIGNPLAFLYRCSHNIVLDHHRRTALRSSVHGDMAQNNRDLLVSELTPERMLESKQRMEAFKAALSRMSELRRRVFLYVRVEGMSVAEAAQHFSMSETSVYKHVSRAMQDCVAALEAAERADGGAE